MVTRITEGRDTVGPNQAVSVMDAIRSYTYNGAYAAFDEDKLGSIELGKLADLIVLSDDILSMPKEKIMDIEVIKTILNGITVYEKKRILDSVLILARLALTVVRISGILVGVSVA